MSIFLICLRFSKIWFLMCCICDLYIKLVCVMEVVKVFVCWWSSWWCLVIFFLESKCFLLNMCEILFMWFCVVFKWLLIIVICVLMVLIGIMIVFFVLVVVFVVFFCMLLNKVLKKSWNVLMRFVVILVGMLNLFMLVYVFYEVIGNLTLNFVGENGEFFNFLG